MKHGVFSERIEWIDPAAVGLGLLLRNVNWTFSHFKSIRNRKCYNKVGISCPLYWDLGFFVYMGYIGTSVIG